MLEPWHRHGYEVWLVDIQHPFFPQTGHIHTDDFGVRRVHYDLTKPWLPPFNRERIAFVSAFPPCSHLAVSGSRWWKGKGLRRLAHSIECFATAAEFCEWAGAPYMIENPKSSIERYWRRPDHSFSPHEFAGLCEDDNYTKQTYLWTGHGFVMPDPVMAEQLGPPDQRILRAPPKDGRASFRSKTPEGFARAVFVANGVA